MLKSYKDEATYPEMKLDFSPIVGGAGYSTAIPIGVYSLEDMITCLLFGYALNNRPTSEIFSIMRGNYFGISDIFTKFRNKSLLNFDERSVVTSHSVDADGDIDVAAASAASAASARPLTNFFEMSRSGKSILLSDIVHGIREKVDAVTPGRQVVIVHLGCKVYESPFMPPTPELLYLRRADSDAGAQSRKTLRRKIFKKIKYLKRKSRKH